MPVYEPKGTAEEVAAWWDNYRQRGYGDDLGRVYGAVEETGLKAGVPFDRAIWSRPQVPEHGTKLEDVKRDKFQWFGS